MKNLFKTAITLTLLTTSALTTSANSAHATTNEELLKMVEKLTEKLESQQLQIQSLKTESAQKNNQPPHIPANIPNTGGVKIKLKPAPSFKSADGNTSFSIDGRIAVDSGFVSNDDSDLGDATDIRYLWLGAKGTVDRDWSYRLLVGLENDRATVNDAYIAYNGFKGTSLRVGNFKEFNGLENMSSNLHNTFIERSSAVTTFRPLRNLGVASTFYGNNWSVQLGAFGDDPGNTASDDEGHSLTGRFVYAPIMNKEENHLLHLGTSVRHRTPDSDNDSVSFSSRGESHVINGALVNTGTISNVDDWITYGAEMRYTYGPISIMGEYNTTNVQRETSTDLTFDGGYLAASYFLTGEQRGYKVKNGTYGRVKPKSNFSRSGDGIGAWEVAARYSTLDLNDKDISGGKLEAYTMGVNWYPTSNTKFMANYIMNKTDNKATTPNNEPNYFMLRGQMDF